MAWNPGDDVIAVQRAPQPSRAGGVYRAFGETLRGLKTTFARIPEGPMTFQYPEEKTPEHRVSAGERYAAVYEINLSRCIFCGYCEVACPFDAITMGHDYEMSDYDRSDLIFTKEMLLAEPFERTPLRAEGE